MRALGLSVVAGLLLAGCAGAPSGTLYTGMTLIDPARERVLDEAWLVVEDGRIAGFGEGAAPNARYDTVRDMTGQYVLPGFIDVHGHLTAGPHTIEVVDGLPSIRMESVDAITAFHASMALASGVTTVRNPGGPPQASAAYDARLADGTWIGPEVRHAGAVIQPPPFGGSAFAYPQTPEAWDAEAARQAALGMTYFKLYHGLSEAELAAGVDAARTHGLEPIAHLDQVSWTRAVEIGVRGLLHALPTSPDLLSEDQRAAYLAERGMDARFAYQWFERVDLDGPEMTALYEAIRETGTSVDLTLQVNAMMVDPGAFDRLFGPEAAAAIHPDTYAALRQFVVLSLTGWTEEDRQRSIAAMETVYAFARRLHAEGVRLGVGTDGPGGGPAYLVELRLMEEAGFSPWEILTLATQGGARVMRIEDRTGQIAAGYEADLVFLSGNPLDDIEQAGQVRAVVSDGVYHDAVTLRAAASEAR